MIESLRASGGRLTNKTEKCSLTNQKLDRVCG